MIRKAILSDIPAIAAYDDLFIHEKQNGSNSNWKWGIYPTVAVPESRVPAGTMYVLEENGEICASMVLNHEQAVEYAGIDWNYPGDGGTVLVIHTLCISPRKARRGYGRQMIQYAKERAAETGCATIRIDTYAHNEPAKNLYLKNGFQIAGYGSILLQGLIAEEQVYLEYKVSPNESAGTMAGTELKPACRQKTPQDGGSGTGHWMPQPGGPADSMAMR